MNPRFKALTLKHYGPGHPPSTPPVVKCDLWTRASILASARHDLQDIVLHDP
jgi:hypothetical protein